jgi:hypothetical protein
MTVTNQVPFFISQTEHETFTSGLENILKIALSTEDDQISSAILKFCAQYIAGLEAGDETHPVTLSVFKWLLSVSINNLNCDSISVE